MRIFFRWWKRDTEGLEQAKLADAQAEQRLRESKATASWARSLDSGGPDELTKLFMKSLGGQA